MTSPFAGRTKRGQNTGYTGAAPGHGHPARPSPALTAGPAMAMLCFTSVIGSAHHARPQPRDIRAHPGTRGAGLSQRRRRPGFTRQYRSWRAAPARPVRVVSAAADVASALGYDIAAAREEPDGF